MKSMLQVAVVMIAVVLSAGVAWAKPAFKQAPDGDYDGAVATITTADSAPATPKIEALKVTDTVTQYGITWTFDKKVPVGQFVTGDWYVVGPVTVASITPKPLFGQEVVDHPDWKLINQSGVREEKYKGKWLRNGSTLNQPVTDTFGAFDSRLSHGHYRPEQVAKLPIAMKPGDSLISTISTPDPIDYRGYGQPVLTAAVLTCMEKPVPPDAFRPSYCDRANKVYLARNLKRNLLHALPRPKTAPENLNQWARAFQRPWLDTVTWGYASPKRNMPRYGQHITRGVSTAALLLHLDYPAIEKERLLIHTVQYGVDLWGIVRAGYRGWNGHGGFGGGRKWTLIFAGMMLGDNDMRSPNTTYPKCHFGEDDQTRAGKCWTGHDVIFESHPGWRPHFTETKHPREWEKMQSESYRRCCTSGEWPGQALAARMMRAEKYWNHDPFFAYVDRWMTEDHAKELITLREAAKTNPKLSFPNWWNNLITIYQKPQKKTFFREMWITYRNNLPPAKP
jgi:hypothetical protein